MLLEDIKQVLCRREEDLLEEASLRNELRRMEASRRRNEREFAEALIKAGMVEYFSINWAALSRAANEPRGKNGKA